MDLFIIETGIELYVFVIKYGICAKVTFVKIKTKRDRKLSPMRLLSYYEFKE